MNRALSISFASAAALLALAASGCERVSYYSVSGASGGADDDGPSGPGGPVTSAGPGGGGGSSATTRPQVLAAVATCAAALHVEASEKASALSAAADAFASSPTEANRDAARAAWRAAIGAWQQAEVLRLGAAGPPTLPAGQGLRDYVYSWPLVSRCVVDQTTVSEAFESPSFGQTALLNARGLAAAEYLLFHEAPDNGCSSAASINSSGAWAALGTDEIAARRRAYAAVVAADVSLWADVVRDDWQGSFAATLSGAGSSGSPFESDQQALNAVSDGLFYLEREVKDLKLGKPLGLYECTESSCPTAVESQYALVSRDHVRNNLVGFQRVFSGCEASGGVGFDDLMRSLGAVELADRLEADTLAAIAAADAVGTADLRAALTSNRAEVEALHAAVKKLTDELKTDFISVLDLEAPQIIEGDND